VFARSSPKPTSKRLSSNQKLPALIKDDKNKVESTGHAYYFSKFARTHKKPLNNEQTIIALGCYLRGPRHECTAKDHTV
jgi:hypothetical protein